MGLDDTDPSFYEANPVTGHLLGVPVAPDEARVIVVPVPFDATTSYGQGTARAPRRVLEASYHVEMYDDWVGETWRQGIAMLPIPTRIEALNGRARSLVLSREIWGPPTSEADRAIVAEVDACGAQVNDWLRAEVAAIFDRGRIPGVLGGDHSVSFGAIAEAKARVPDLGILHIDAHADLRERFGGFTWSHASILHNVWSKLSVAPIVSVGIRDLSPVEHRLLEECDDFHPLPARRIDEATLTGRPFADLVDEALAPLPPDVWITFDVDGLEPGLCPNTGTPVPGGLTFAQMNLLLHRLAESRRIVGFDLVEIGDGELDANVGARILLRLATWAVQTNPARR